MATARLVLLLTPILSLAACGDSGGEQPQQGGEPKRVVVIPKGTSAQFWQAVNAGAQAAAGKSGLEATFKGPLEESDRAAQKQLMQQFVSEGVAGIALAPLDQKALVPEVKRATQKGIPVVIFDSALDAEVGKDFATFIATDNRKGGEIAGAEMARLLGNQGKVVLLRFQVGSASTTAREEGFLEVVRGKGIEVLVDNRYAGASTGEAKTSALNLADELKQADGVFCPCEPVTKGMMLALDQLDLTGKLKFVGFDCTAPLRKGLEDGKIHALVVQDPHRMGQLAVESLKALIDGGKVEPFVDTGCVLATKANMNEPEVAPLLK